MPSVKVLNKFNKKLIKRQLKKEKTGRYGKNFSEDEELINALKDEISKKETKKIAEEKLKGFTAQNSEKRKLKYKMKKIKKS